MAAAYPNCHLLKIAAKRICEWGLHGRPRRVLGPPNFPSALPGIILPVPIRFLSVVCGTDDVFDCRIYEYEYRSTILTDH